MRLKQQTAIISQVLFGYDIRNARPVDEIGRIAPRGADRSRFSVLTFPSNRRILEAAKVGPRTRAQSSLQPTFTFRLSNIGAYPPSLRVFPYL